MRRRASPRCWNGTECLTAPCATAAVAAPWRDAGRPSCWAPPGGRLPVLTGMLGDRNLEVRCVAVRALGAIGDAKAAPPLVALLVSSRPVPASLVAVALVRLCPGPEAVLVEALDSRSDLVRAMAAEVLGLAGAVTAGTALLSVLVSDSSEDVRVRAARALGRIGVPSSLPALTEAVTSGQSAGLRAAAAAALGELGSPVAVPVLRTALDDESAAVARTAAGALVALGTAGITALRGLTDSDATAAAYASEVLALLDLRAAVRPALLREEAA